MTATADGEAMDAARPEPIDRTVDWLLTAILVAFGLVATLAGVLLARNVSLEWSRSLVAEMETTSSLVSEAVLIDAIHQLAHWGGIGLVVVGVSLAACGVLFLGYRTRRRRRARGPDTLTPVLIGAVVSAVLFVVPFSPAIGGGAAAFLGRNSVSGLRIGALAGIALVAPLVVLGGFLVAGALSAGATAIALIVALAVVVSAGVTVGTSAVGGWLGRGLAEDGAAI